jgi:hypothetical protein
MGKPPRSYARTVPFQSQAKIRAENKEFVSRANRLAGQESSLLEISLFKLSFRRATVTELRIPRTKTPRGTVALKQHGRANRELIADKPPKNEHEIATAIHM